MYLLNVYLSIIMGIYLSETLLLKVEIPLKKGMYPRSQLCERFPVRLPALWNVCSLSFLITLIFVTYGTLTSHLNRDWHLCPCWKQESESGAFELFREPGISPPHLENAKDISVISLASHTSSPWQDNRARFSSIGLLAWRIDTGGLQSRGQHRL